MESIRGERQDVTLEALKEKHSPVDSIYIQKPSIDAATLVQNLPLLLKEDPTTCESPELSLTINNHQASLQWNIPLSIYIAINYDARLVSRVDPHPIVKRIQFVLRMHWNQRLPKHDRKS